MRVLYVQVYYDVTIVHTSLHPLSHNHILTFFPIMLVNLDCCKVYYYLVMSADIRILLWFCTCYKSLPRYDIFTLGRNYCTLGSTRKFSVKNKNNSCRGTISKTTKESSNPKDR